MRFQEKLTILMRRQALSNLALSRALGGIAHTTVARWLGGARPRGEVARRLADYFRVPVETLLNDESELPADVTETSTSPLVPSAQQIIFEMARENPAAFEGALAKLREAVGVFDIENVRRKLEKIESQIQEIKKMLPPK